MSGSGDAQPPEGSAAHGLQGVEFEELVREVLTRMNTAVDEQTRLRLLLDAVVTMAADLSLESVLSRIVAIARRLVDANYAALGVLGGGPERPLRTFVHHGFDDEQVARIGDLPAGHGLLGLLIDRPEPLRLHDIAEHPQSYGFPPHHPPMHSFLGVPVRIREEVFGNLYLTEKVGGGDFTAEDQDIVVALAAAASVVIQNARLYEEAAQREAWLQATAEMTAAVTGSRDGSAVATVTERARTVSGADAAWVVEVGPTGDLQVLACSPAGSMTEALAPAFLGQPGVWDALQQGQVVASPVEAAGGQPHDEADPPWAVLTAPLPVSPGVPRALCLGWAGDAGGHRDVDPEALGRYSREAGLALQVAAAREDHQRLLLLEDRDRIARDLHDLVVQRLFAVGLSLQGAARLSTHPEMLERLEHATEDLDTTIKDIRRTIFALGASESDQDVQTTVTRVVDRAAATLKVRPRLRFEGPVRSATTPEVAAELVAVLAEALSNASRHADAGSVEVTVSADDHIVLVVSDDGRGMHPEVVESGLANIRRRAERLGGRFSVDSGPDEGTTLRWAVPVG